PLRSAENWATVFISEEIGIDLRPKRTARLCLQVLRENAAQTVTEIALVDGAAGKLVRNLQDLRRCGVAKPPARDHCWRCQCARKYMPSVHFHRMSPPFQGVVYRPDRSAIVATNSR